ncbi:MAG: hypothetical protein LKJ17_00045 [Oscillospiraceae bacterium]|jgi:hypothetical protein|nr:hypothetical protein [Oscillospiraceae bacterium]
MATELQTRYANLVDAKLRAELVTIDVGTVPVFNTDYEGEPKSGAVKIPVRDTEVASGTYDPVTGKELTSSDTTYLTVTDFNDVAINEVIDGYEAAAIPDNIVADRLDSAAYTGSKILDQDGIATLEAKGTAASSTTALTKSTVYEAVVDAMTALTTANVPMTNRFLIVSPATYALMLKDTTNFIRQSDLSQQMVNDGYIGMYSGFAIKVSNLLAASTEFIAGHSRWCHRIREWVVAPRIQDLNGDGKHIGASAVQGRWVYKHAVSKAAAVYVKKNA